MDSERAAKQGWQEFGRKDIQLLGSGRVFDED